ncbi:MAG TPA: hypothetical protein VNE59_12470 [Burkholderiales bacterium]|nr:hypothetical protein [Burkholderiales bacterium]
MHAVLAPRRPSLRFAASRAATRPGEDRSAPAARPRMAPRLALVWRRAAPQAADSRAAMRDSISALPATSRSSAVPGDPIRSPAPAPAAVPGAREALRGAALDPALADRLADDVVRRVERRMRIERERRGV